MLNLDGSELILKLDATSATQVAHEAYGSEFEAKFMAKEALRIEELAGIMNKDEADVIANDPVVKYEKLLDFRERFYEDALAASDELAAAQIERTAAVKSLSDSWKKHGKTLSDAFAPSQPSKSRVARGIKKVADKLTISEKLAMSKLEAIEKKGSITDIETLGGLPLVTAYVEVKNAKERAKDATSVVPRLESNKNAIETVLSRFIGENKGKLKRADHIATHYRIHPRKRMDVINTRIHRASTIGAIGKSIDAVGGKISKTLGRIRADKLTTTAAVDLKIPDILKK